MIQNQQFYRGTSYLTKPDEIGNTENARKKKAKFTNFHVTEILQKVAIRNKGYFTV